MARPSSHGAKSRQHVIRGQKPVRGLWKRRLANGDWVYDGYVKGQLLLIDGVIDDDAAAVRAYEALKVDAERGVELQNPALSPTIKDLGRDWLKDLRRRVELGGDHAVSASTPYNCESTLKVRIVPYVGQIKVTDLTVRDVRGLIDALRDQRKKDGTRKYAELSVRNAVTTLSMLLSFAIDEQYIQRNVVHDLPRKARPSTTRGRQPMRLSQGVLDRLFARLEEPWRTAILVMALTGLRLSEVLGLRWRDVDLQAGTVTVAGQLVRNSGKRPRDKQHVRAKTPHSHATVRMPPMLVRALAAHRAEQAKENIAIIGADAWVFAWPNGDRRGQNTLGRHLQTASIAIGIGDPYVEGSWIRSHDLRHTFAAHAIDEGTRTPKLVTMMRHAGSGVTYSTYSGLIDGTDDSAWDALYGSGYGA